MSDLTRREQLLLRAIARELQHQLRMHEIECHSPRRGTPEAELRERQQAEERLATRLEEGLR